MQDKLNNPLNARGNSSKMLQSYQRQTDSRNDIHPPHINHSKLGNPIENSNAMSLKDELYADDSNIESITQSHPTITRNLKKELQMSKESSQNHYGGNVFSHEKMDQRNVQSRHNNSRKKDIIVKKVSSHQHIDRMAEGVNLSISASKSAQHRDSSMQITKIQTDSDVGIKPQILQMQENFLNNLRSFEHDSHEGKESKNSFHDLN